MASGYGWRCRRERGSLARRRWRPAGEVPINFVARECMEGALCNQMIFTSW
jgi:hypothetical protein